MFVVRRVPGMVVLGATAIGLWILSGCAGHRGRGAMPAPAAYSPVSSHAPNADAAAIVTPQESLEGKVAWQNSNLRFVVLTFPGGQMPGLGQRMAVFRQGLKVGEIKITGPQRDDSVVGDIVAGQARPGDAVRSQ